ncbi:MAG: hypothetical protein ACLQF0_01460 [Dissulfurispiraceae bacterium]
MKRTNQQTSSAAVLATGAELSRRAYDVTFTLGNTPKVDMMCSVPEGQAFKIQVKGISNPRDFWVNKSFFDGPTQPNLYLVVVLVSKEAQDDLSFHFFILSHEEAQKEFNKLPITKKDGSPITQFGLGWTSVKRYKNKWDTFPHSSAA